MGLCNGGRTDRLRPARIRALSQPAGQRGSSPDPSGRVASWGFVSGVVSAGLSYVIQPVIGRLLSPAANGEAQSLLALYMMLAMPATPLVLVITRRVTL